MTRIINDKDQSLQQSFDKMIRYTFLYDITIIITNNSELTTIIYNIILYR